MRRKRSAPIIPWTLACVIALYGLFQFSAVSNQKENIRQLEHRISAAKRALSDTRGRLEETKSTLVQRQNAHLNVSLIDTSSSSSSARGRSPKPATTSFGAATSLDWSPKTSQFRNGPFGKPREGEGVVYVLGLHGAMIDSYVTRWNGRGPYVREILRSVRSLKLNSPNTRVSVVTDEPHLSDEVRSYFEYVIVHNATVKVGWGHKIPGLLRTPYEKTLFLDADTVVCWPLDDLFVHLNHTQLGSVVEPGLYTEHLRNGLHSTKNFWYSPWVLGHQVNSGMLIYRSDPAVLSMFSAWHNEFTEKNGVWGGHPQTDQAFLAHILDRTRGVKYIYLPAEYNMRVHANTFPHLLRRPVYVLHSRYAECGIVNERLGPRLFDFRKNTTVYWWAAGPDASRHAVAGSGADYELQSYCACDHPKRSSSKRMAHACATGEELAAPSTMFTWAQFACVNQSSIYAEDEDL